MPAPLTQSSPTQISPLPALYLYPLNDSFIPKHIALSTPGQRVKIGRQTNAKTTPGERNGYFDSKVLSRAHAEIWEDGGKIYIKDVKSSNGTFINGERLSQEGMESEPFELKSDDIVEFGIDIVGEDNKTIVHHKVAARVVCVFTEQDALMAARSEQQHMQPGSSSIHQSSLASSSNGQSNMGSLPAAQKSNQFPPRLTGMGGMGGSMRPPGKSGLTFEHILTRLQGELQKSRDTGAELGALSGSMGEIGETLGGTLPPSMPSYPNPSSLPPVRHSPPVEEHHAPSASADHDGKRRKSLTEQLDEHEQKVRILEEKLKEQEGMWSEIRGMLFAKQRAEEEEREYQRQQQQEREHENDYDDDDAKSISTVTGGLEPVDEEEEPEEDFSRHEQTMQHDQDRGQDNEREERQQEHVRPRTPEPSLALQSQVSEPQPTPQPEYSAIIADLTLKVTQLTEQLAESRDVIRSLEEKVSAYTMAPPPAPQPEIDWAQKWEEMARRVGRVEETVEKVRETSPERRSMEDMLPPSPRSLSSDSMRQRRRGRSSSVRRTEPVEALEEAVTPNGVTNGNASVEIVKENGEVKVKGHLPHPHPKDAAGRRDATMTALGIVILSVAAATVVWKVRE